MIKCQLIISIFFFAICFTSCFTIRKNNVLKKNTEDIALTAEKELPQILEKIPAGQENLYGFTNRDEFSQAKTGEPFEFYSLEKDELKKTTSFRVPVIVEDEFRALATVESIRDTLHIVDFGANILAKEIQTVCIENSKLNFIGVLRMYSVFSDFVIMSGNKEYLFIPLTSAKMYLQSIGIVNPEKSYSRAQIINLFKNKQND